MFNKVADYFKSSWAELIKVNWPNRNQIVSLTVIVIVFSLVVSSFVGAVDWGFARAIEKVIFNG